MQYDVVFEGGGAKGMVLVGACEEFFSRGHTFDRLLGTSAGAITATLLAAGYTTQEMLDALAEKDSRRDKAMEERTQMLIQEAKMEQRIQNLEQRHER